MPTYDELIEVSAGIEVHEPAGEKIKPRSLSDYFSLAVTTFGVGYIPLAPGTWGSAVGVLIYLLFCQAEFNFLSYIAGGGGRWRAEQLSAWIWAINSLLLGLFCLVGIWASGRATRLFANKDPQKVVVDEVLGQLITFIFIPFGGHWGFVLAGFLLFRLFDIWKPYPINSLEALPEGLGICADDILAGVYAGICLAGIYAISITI